MQESNLPGVKLLTRGKVRDMYDLGEQLLIVVTDRISAFDVVLPTAIPGKGKVLNQLSSYWFDETEHILPNHVLTTNVEEYPDQLHAHASQLEGRSMLVRRAERVISSASPVAILRDRVGWSTRNRGQSVGFIYRQVWLKRSSFRNQSLPQLLRPKQDMTSP